MRKAPSGGYSTRPGACLPPATGVEFDWKARRFRRSAPPKCRPRERRSARFRFRPTGSRSCWVPTARSRAATRGSARSSQQTGGKSRRRCRGARCDSRRLPEAPKARSSIPAGRQTMDANLRAGARRARKPVESGPDRRDRRLRTTSKNLSTRSRARDPLSPPHTASACGASMRSALFPPSDAAERIDGLVAACVRLAAGASPNRQHP